MDTYRRQLAAQLAQTLLVRGGTSFCDIASQATDIACEVTERLRAVEAGEAAAVDDGRCGDKHPLDSARCRLRKEVEHDLHLDDRGREW